VGHHEEDRAFLHALATPITIVKMLTQTHLEELGGSITAQPVARQIERMKNVIEQITIIENLHADHKARITERG
jgi:hypothetical protein